MPRVAAVVLAAGGSSRLGTPKQLLQFRGRSLLQNCAETALAAGCDPVIVVLGADAERMQPELKDLPVSVAFNPRWQGGIGSSIRRGIKQLAEHDDISACLILLCDQPLITSASLQGLVRTFAESGKSICATSYGGTIGPPVIASRQYFTDLLTLPDRQGAKRLWLDHPDDLLAVPMPEAHADVDTVEDWEQIRAPDV